MHFFSFYTPLKYKLKNILRDMKHSKILILSLMAAMTFSACGTDDSLQFNFPEQNKPGDNTGGNTGSTDANNTNKNVATANMPQVVRNAIGGLEFPKIKGIDNNYVIVHMDGNMVNYSTEWNDSKKSQRWSCYTYNTKNTTKTEGVVRYKPTSSSQRQYPWDTDLKEQYGVTDFTADPYPTSAHFDHGHICSSDERKYSNNQQYQTFYMTNMQPQYRDFNQKGTWYNMERELIKLAPKFDTDTLYIVKGGTIDSEDNIIEYRKNGAVSKTQLDGYIPIPKYFFVAVLKKEFNKATSKYTYSAFGYWFPHVDEAFKSDDRLGNYVVNIKTLEARTGIDFFCNLPDDVEKQVEEQDVNAIKSIWGFK